MALAWMAAAAVPAWAEEGFRNPIVSSGADPWVILHEGTYYYCYSRSDMVAVKKAKRLQDIDLERHRFVWNPTPGEAYSRELWAPELHYLEGKWYIYVAADDGRNENHRMYVLEGTTQNPQDPFTLVGKIADQSDRWTGTPGSKTDARVLLHRDRLRPRKRELHDLAGRNGRLDRLPRGQIPRRRMEPRCQGSALRLDERWGARLRRAA